MQNFWIFQRVIGNYHSNRNQSYAATTGIKPMN